MLFASEKKEIVVPNRRIGTLIALLLFFAMGISSECEAETFTFWGGGGDWLGDNDSGSGWTPQAVCNVAYSVNHTLQSTPRDPTEESYNADYLSTGVYICNPSAMATTGLGGKNAAWIEVLRRSVTCFSGEYLRIYNGDDMGCWVYSSLGQSKNDLSCTFSPGVADPIDSITGNVFYEETDYSAKNTSFKIGRYYNSTDSTWRHSYSSYLIIADASVLVVKDDGGMSTYSSTSDGYSSSIDKGRFFKDSDGWHYMSVNGELSSYSLDGRLASRKFSSGELLTLSYVSLESGNTQITITNRTGISAVLVEDSLHRPVSGSFLNINTSYTYSQAGELLSTSRILGGTAFTRNYLYEDPNYSSALTGVIDERGIRSETWTYDYAGRGNSNSQANGMGKISLLWNYDSNPEVPGDDWDSTTITNELGKKVIYHYSGAANNKRIVKIEGSPSANCPASNSTFTYNDQGQVASKTDAKGNITIYKYDLLGFEISRTEASGSAQSKTTTTEWDPLHFLRTKVTDPTQTTVYTYDAEGRQLTQVTTPNLSH